MEAYTTKSVGYWAPFICGEKAQKN